MPARIGIELSPTACRIVDLGRSARAEGADTVVRAFARTPAADEATLAPYRRRHAAVVMWGLHGEHRQAVVTVGSYQRMRREAVNATRQAGVDTRQMVADIAPATTGKDGGRRRPVVVALAPASDVAAALRPLTAAGVRVRSIVTPALALMSLARMRRRITAPGMAEAYVALEEAGTAIALVRDGALVAARELEWGYQDDQQARPRDEVARRLGEAIEEFFGDCGVRSTAISQICVCGGLPELRSMTVALMERFDVEVEPLDSLFGIDAGHLPEPADDFQERIVDMRLAWAVAADWNAPINFLRERRRRLAKTILTRAAVIAGVATGLAVAWRIQRSDLLDPAKPAASAPAVRPATLRPTIPAPPPVIVLPPPEAIPPVAVAVTPPPIVATRAPTPTPLPVPVPALTAVQTQPARVRPAQVQAAPPIVQQAPPRTPARVPAPPPAPALVLTPVPLPAPVASAPVRTPPVAPPPVRLAPVAAPPARVDVAPQPVRRPPPEEVALPFDATLGTILYAADRKLAIVDGHIVQVGDEVRGARVVDITPNAVVFRDRQGRLRRLTLEDPGR